MGQKLIKQRVLVVKATRRRRMRWRGGRGFLGRRITKRIADWMGYGGGAVWMPRKHNIGKLVWKCPGG
jgi:hypothetical protein